MHRDPAQRENGIAVDRHSLASIDSILHFIGSKSSTKRPVRIATKAYDRLVNIDQRGMLLPDSSSKDFVFKLFMERGVSFLLQFFFF